MSNGYKRIRTDKETTHTNNVRNAADNITDKLDEQAVANYE